MASNLIGPFKAIIPSAATLEESPGTAVQLSVTYLSQSLLEFMHATEGSYSLVRLRNINLHVGTNLQSFRLVTQLLSLGCKAETFHVWHQATNTLHLYLHTSIQG